MFKNILEKIKKYKSYILIVCLVFLTLFSVVKDNIKENTELEINGNKIQTDNKDGKIAVYIAGEVVSPGVYYIEENLRLDDVIKICGGFTQNADISQINLAEKLNDSDKIEIPSLKTIDENMSEYEEDDESGYININTASKEELKTLNGIGETLANNIIEYRKNNRFSSTEELLNVNGIGQSKYDSIKEYICVN